METKTCSLCNQDKLLNEYTQRKKECRECRNKKGREYYKAHKEEIIERKEQYRRAMKNHKIECACGAVVQNLNLDRHKESQKHKNFIEGKIKEKKLTISYYDEDCDMKKQFITVDKEKYHEFQGIRSRLLESNYKNLKRIKYI